MGDECLSVFWCEKSFAGLYYIRSVCPHFVFCVDIVSCDIFCIIGFNLPNSGIGEYCTLRSWVPSFDLWLPSDWWVFPVVLWVCVGSIEFVCMGWDDPQWLRLLRGC